MVKIYVKAETFKSRSVAPDPLDRLVERSRYAAEKNFKTVYAPILAQFRALFKKEYAMNKAETNRFNKLYQRHLHLLKLQGKSQKTIDAYSRAVRRINEYFDCCPDQLTPEQLEKYFSKLVESHSWSTLMVMLYCPLASSPGGA